MDSTPISDRLNRIRKCLGVLRGFQPMTYEEFAGNQLYTDAAQHNLQVATQAALDVGSLILADRSCALPKAYKDIFPALADLGVIPLDLAHRLVGMAKFRNVLVHLYLEVDMRVVYRRMLDSLTDFSDFLRHLGDWVLANAGED